MSFFEQQLHPRISFGAKGGPAFSSEVIQTTGGQRYANRNWTYPLHRYDISEGVKSPADFELIRSMFYNVFGQFDGFRFKDWADFELTDQPLSMISSGIFQLNRSYVLGVRTFVRPIFKPVASTIVLTRHRAGTPSTPSASIDYTTGQATISGDMAGDTYTATGEFDVPVAFTSDFMEAEIVTRGAQAGLLVQWPSIQLQEIRL